jgi:hypothetical protein
VLRLHPFGRRRCHIQVATISASTATNTTLPISRLQHDRFDMDIVMHPRLRRLSLCAHRNPPREYGRTRPSSGRLYRRAQRWGESHPTKPRRQIALRARRDRGRCGEPAPSLEVLRLSKRRFETHAIQRCH